MSERDALYAAILANPDDDTPRLVYADWLDENGDDNDRARARFIRLQCDANRHEMGSARRESLERDAWQLRSQHGQEWGSTLDGVVLANYTSWSRGFVDKVMMYSKRFVAEGEKVFSTHPVRFVKFVDLGARGAVSPRELLACPHLARLRTVQFVGEPLNDAFAKELSQCPFVASLVGLRLRRCTFSPKGLRAILESSSLPNLREMSIGECGRSAHLAAIAGSAALARIKDLELWKCRIDKVGALARSQYAAGLESLRIDHDKEGIGHRPLRGPGAVAIARSPHLRGLKSLALEHQELRKKGSEEFARSYSWSDLQRLSLRSNGILPSALSAFSSNSSFGSLRHFDLRGNPVRLADIEALKQRFPNTTILTDDMRQGAAAGPSSEGEA
jgi:uncharacterized protein (TIGR02996 family)